MNKVLIIDVNLGNIGSIEFALARIGCDIVKTQVPPNDKDYQAITHVILPGVGAFKYGMDNLKSWGWQTWLQNKFISSESH